MTTTTELERAAPAMRGEPSGATPADSQPVGTGTAADALDWSGPCQARIVRPLCSAPDEPNQVSVPAGCCDIQWGADTVLLSWWGRGKVRQITMPGRELDRLFAAGLIEWD